MRKLSVIIPVYNEEQHNLEALVRALSGMGLEIIIIDDGSDMPVQLSSYPKGCQVARRNINTGYGAAIKYGISIATGDYIGIIDADF